MCLFLCPVQVLLRLPIEGGLVGKYIKRKYGCVEREGGFCCVWLNGVTETNMCIYVFKSKNVCMKRHCQIQKQALLSYLAFLAH